MAKDLFFSMDLNLLRTFLVLSQELNTRKASERLHVSQPAVSQGLQKLRAQLGDELFVKAPNGLKATPFAEQLALEVSPYLNGLSVALNKNRSFDPLSLNASIRIAVAPIVLTCLSGALFRHFSRVAPHCTLELVAWKGDSLKSIQSDETTLGVSFVHEPGQGVHMLQLVELEARIIVRNGHPIQSKTVTPAQMESYPIASVITPGYNEQLTEAAMIMEKEGLEPTVGFRSEFAMAVIDVIENTDFFMPHSTLFPVKRYPLLKALTPLIDGEPYLSEIYAYYNMKYRDTEFIMWLIEQVQQVIKQETVHDN
ncbi:LysR family transcriptional regulator [Vibrio hippocampi]|uniref:HTH-type transcriptional regulator YidZ n=1 Tax=Vibrio hippocampi TaxID=654686 RepID=A0ABM8ZGE4_9VIBR|nr:LysR family transcriptional regulator [Vibrio hippocampi]CAH0525687.1 HTH-type transcriptional regulator YidZ [Vibrio hippocampi]